MTDGSASPSAESTATNRAVTPVVGKTLEIALVLLFIAGLSSTLFGGIVPDYRTAAGVEVAERTVVSAAARVDAAIPPTVQSAHVVHRVPLPDTIRGTTYRIVVENRTLSLEHPISALDTTVRLALPPRVDSVSGTWYSNADTVVVIESTAEGLSVELVNR